MLWTQKKFRDWLNSGRFTLGGWDEKLHGLKRPFAELTDTEKLQYMTNEVLDHEADGWDQVVINGIPLLARTLEDATDWASFFYKNKHQDTQRQRELSVFLNDILEDDPFRSVSPIPSTRGRCNILQAIDRKTLAFKIIFTLEMISLLLLCSRDS